LRHGLERVESGLDRIFTPAWNPFYQLGALGWYFYWVVAGSGVYLFIFYDTGVFDAYASVERITVAQWYAGGIMRSLHRYASDAMVVVMMLHLVREFLLERLYGKRWFAWFTGIPIIWFVYTAGITGYWLVWDKLAQYVAILTTEWLSVLPMFSGSLARNFLHDSILSSRFFTLMVFIHIAVPLLTLLVMWIHIQRHARPRMNPPKGLAIGMMLAMLALSIVKPAVSQGPAELAKVVTEIKLDWFYLPVYPLLDHLSGLWLWIGLVGVTAFVAMAPWLTRRVKPQPAQVNLEGCNGCGWCVADCPYSAVILGPRTDGRPYQSQAVVQLGNCVSCGICAGACPSASPFRRTGELAPGIELPDLRTHELRERSVAAAKGLSGKDRVIVYGCRHGADLTRFAGPGVGVVQVSCAAAVPPSFIDFLISRHHADGVFFTGCRDNDCQERLGARWLQQRIAGERDPHLRQRVARERIEIYWAGIDHDADLRRRIEAFRQRLRELPPIRPPHARDDAIAKQEGSHV
ncbi:MAG: hydrogenase iron-sulfur subunit, partial [Gammaproteobacteria bacterium]|nr:hydrogenase iron-sulfur subunit [Gammaproteobacteria bacterium]